MYGDINEHIGRMLMRRRRALGLTQRELGAACGVSFQQVQKYECAAAQVSAMRLWQLAAALEVPVSYFFGELASVSEPAVRAERTPAVSIEFQAGR
jgi:transcriptional regulator with XRE-family HTH domain